MRNLLKFEIKKMKKMKSFYICIGIMIVSILITALTLNMIDMSSIEEQTGLFLGKTGIDFMLYAISNASYLTIGGIFVAIFVCGDYEDQTIKNVYAKGYTRNNVYVAKFLSLVFLMTCMFIVTLLSAFLIGTAFWGVGDVTNLKFLAVVGVQYVACIANVALFYAISSIFTRMGGAIALNIIAPIVVGLVLSLIDSIIKIKNFAISNYWLNSFINDTLYLQVTTSRLLVCLGLSIVYFVAFYFLGRYFNGKKEI